MMNGYMIKADDEDGHRDKATEEILEKTPAFEVVFAHFLFFTNFERKLFLW